MMMGYKLKSRAASISDLGLCCENIKNAVNSTLFRVLGGTAFIDESYPFKGINYRLRLLCCVSVDTSRIRSVTEI